MRGLGKKTLTIYQKTSNYGRVPIWIWKTNTGQNWIYGQVPLSAVSAFQVIGWLLIFKLGRAMEF